MSGPDGGGQQSPPARTPKPPADPTGGSIIPFLKWSAFGYGAVAMFVAIGSWGYGEPPTWSIFSSRAEAEVISADVEEVTVADGTVQVFPHVMVRRPGSDDGAVTLRGVIPGFYRSDASVAAELASAYHPGEMVQVRLIDGAAFADRTDGSDLFHAIFMTLAALIMLLTGYLIRPFKSDPSKPPLIRDKR